MYRTCLGFFTFQFTIPKLYASMYNFLIILHCKVSPFFISLKKVFWTNKYVLDD